jgi:hypothetical protein
VGVEQLRIRKHGAAIQKAIHVGAGFDQGARIGPGDEQDFYAGEAFLERGRHRQAGDDVAEIGGLRDGDDARSGAHGRHRWPGDGAPRWLHAGAVLRAAGRPALCRAPDIPVDAAAAAAAPPS